MARSACIARATAAANTLMILSQNTSMPVDRWSRPRHGPLWFAVLSAAGSRRAPRDARSDAQAAGCTAIVVTVDQQASYYERTQQDRNLGGARRRPCAAAGGAPAGAGDRARALPRVAERGSGTRGTTSTTSARCIKVPLLVKGIVTAEDATLCVEHGVDGIIVSNHGGRSMDYGPSTLEVLPEIVAAVNRRVPVITDSGYRRGTDILKALALGADAVLVGRPTRWALGAFGTPGVQHLLEMMQRELVDAAAAAGRPTRASIDAGLVRTRFV